MNAQVKEMRTIQGLNKMWDILNNSLYEPKLRKDLTSKGYLVIDLNTEEGIKSMPKNWNRGFDSASLDFFVDATDVVSDEKPLYPLSHDVKLFYFENGFAKQSDIYSRHLSEMGCLELDTPRTLEREILIEFFDSRNGYTQPYVPNGEMDVEILDFNVPSMSRKNENFDDMFEKSYEDLILTKNEKDFHVVICEDNFLKNRHRIIGYEI